MFLNKLNKSFAFAFEILRDVGFFNVVAPAREYGYINHTCTIFDIVGTFKVKLILLNLPSRAKYQVTKIEVSDLI